MKLRQIWNGFAQIMLSAIKQATAEFKEKYQKNELEDAGVNAGFHHIFANRTGLDRV